MFGYEVKKFGRWEIKIAEPEKAIIDLFYLYPFYNNEFEIEELRFDRDMLKLDVNKLHHYVQKFKIKALENRIKIMIKVYDL
jgi:hypothetical protein